MNNLQDQRDWAPYQFNQYQQWAEIHPTEPNMYRTFFLQRDHLAKKIRIRGETNWVYGEVTQLFVWCIRCIWQRSEQAHCFKNRRYK